MSSKSKRPTPFHQPFHHLSLQKQIRHVAPIAREMLEGGIGAPGYQESMFDHVRAVVGDPHVESLLATVQAGKPVIEDIHFEEAFQIAYALGIALGLMLRSDAFLEGGAR